MLGRKSQYSLKALSRHRMVQAKDSSFLVGSGIAIMATTFIIQKAMQMSQNIDFKSHIPASPNPNPPDNNNNNNNAAAPTNDSKSGSAEKSRATERASEQQRSSGGGDSTSSSSRPSSSSQATGSGSDRKAGTTTPQESAFSAFFSSFFARNFYDGGFEDKMSKREAALILGVRESALPERVKDAHRRVLIINHPDKGGSAYLAAKINEAKDLLLKGKEGR